jgi:hypothetical protein
MWTGHCSSRGPSPLPCTFVGLELLISSLYSLRLLARRRRRVYLNRPTTVHKNKGGSRLKKTKIL